ncbi:MAG: SDR family NAD(P)-dependent oxidoreductase [Akkermansiaceae bacterium]|nr:SDR family NAD(P)-dependent oxidoreductase [Akkermansiaceae bacterium]
MQQAIITGGEGGLGEAISTTLKSAGVDVLSPGRGDLNVADAASVKDYFHQSDDIDLLVCNAGATLDKPLARMSESDWDQVMQVNLKGAFLCAREVSRSMMKRRCGHIIFISSFSAIHPPAGQANYAAAKSALLGMMKSMSQELGARSVRVNAILPGFLETKMTENLSDEVKQAALEKHTLGKFNTPEAVAEFVAHLHQRMPHTSGQVFNLDSRIV